MDFVLQIVSIIKWPLAVIIIVALFRAPISEWIPGVKEWNFFGHRVAASGAQAKAIEDVAPALAAPGSAEEPTTVPSATDTGRQPTPMEEKLAALLASASNASLLWEFRYLNYYLVSRSQHALNWIAETTARSIVEFDATLVQIRQSERLAVIAALRDHGLITVTEVSFEVTPKGRTYVQWPGRKVFISQNTLADREAFEAATTLTASVSTAATVETKVIRASDSVPPPPAAA